MQSAFSRSPGVYGVPDQTAPTRSTTSVQCRCHALEDALAPRGGLLRDVAVPEGPKASLRASRPGEISDLRPVKLPADPKRARTQEEVEAT